MGTTLQARGWNALRLVGKALIRVELPTIVVWLALAMGLAAIARRVVDWFVMTDELLYERLAISVSRLHSPLPHVHDVLIPNGSQLYSLLIAPAFAHGYVPASLHSAHILNAYVMTSAAIPAFLLARTVTGRRSAAYFVAVFSVCVPWMVFSSFLLTEVVAYPAFLWALLGLHRSVVAPRVLNDVLGLLGIALATLARTQFFVLVLVLAPAIVLHETSFAEGSTWVERLRVGAHRAVSRHRLLGGVYAILAVTVIVLSAAGRLSSTVGTYAQAVEGNPFPAHFVPSLAEHVATIALGMAILPFVIAVAWLVSGLAGGATRERHAFAAVGVLAIGVLSLEVTSFDLRFGGGVVRERYLFYIVPVVLVAFAGALCDRRWPRWSLLVPMPLLLYGFWHSALHTYPKLNIDTPVSVLYDELLKLVHGHRAAHVTLVLGTIVVAGLFAEAAIFVRRAYVVAVLALLVAVAFPLETRYAFQRLFAIDGTSGRPLTLDQGGVFDWVDRTLGTTASVTMVPFPSSIADYYASVGFWWDMEFWNKSVDRAVYRPGQFLWTPSTFPKLMLSFDPNSGLANRSPTQYVVEGNKETRFRIAGNPVPANTDTRDMLLLKATMPWRAEWLTFGLTDDGWTRPNREARIRIFAPPGQAGAVTRTLTLGVRAPFDVGARPFRAISNRTDVRAIARGSDRALVTLEVCVPAHGYSDVRVSTPESSPIFGDPRNAETFFTVPRNGGVIFTEIAVADEIGPAC